MKSDSCHKTSTFFHIRWTFHTFSKNHNYMRTCDILCLFAYYWCSEYAMQYAVYNLWKAIHVTKRAHFFIYFGHFTHFQKIITTWGHVIYCVSLHIIDALTMPYNMQYLTCEKRFMSQNEHIFSYTLYISHIFKKS